MAPKTPAVVMILAAVVTLAGCHAMPGAPAEGVACASWEAYESDAQRTEDSDAVLTVTDVERDGTMSILGFDANAYTVRVVGVDKGDPTMGYTMRVGSTADACRPYRDGDPMLSAETLRLFLTRDDAGWQTLTPFDGVQPID